MVRCAGNCLKNSSDWLTRSTGGDQRSSPQCTIIGPFVVFWTSAKSLKKRTFLSAIDVFAEVRKVPQEYPFSEFQAKALDPSGEVQLNTDLS